MTIRDNVADACHQASPILQLGSAPEGIRTPNLLIRSQMLYPLSYGRLSSVVAEARGFEPPVPFEGDNSLAVSPIRPLWHASIGLVEGTRPLPGVFEPPEA